MSKTLQGHRTKLDKTKQTKGQKKSPTVSSRGQTTVILCSTITIAYSSPNEDVVSVKLLVLSASFNYDNYAASDVLWMMTLSLHSFMRSSRAESIIAAVS